MTTQFFNGRIFDGESFASKKLVVDGNHFANSDAGFRCDQEIDLEGGFLAPAFIDIQLYGGNGLLFGEHPSVESLSATYEYSVQGGATNIFPTVGTNSDKIMFEAIEAVRKYWERGLPGIAGLHLEGPFINPAKRGAHIAKFIKKPLEEDVSALLEKSQGILKLMTLAPEQCDQSIINMLQNAGVIISAGHTNATYEEAMKGFESISIATHLYNAMSALQHRSPGMVGAIFNSQAMASIVADGHHVDFAAIMIAKKIMGPRLFYITDAVTTNTSGEYLHKLEGDKYVVADGTLSGSSLTMMKCVANGVQYANIPLEESLRMASLYPAKAVQLDHKLGKIKAGFNAELVWFTEDFQVKGVYTCGSFRKFA